MTMKDFLVLMLLFGNAGMMAQNNKEICMKKEQLNMTQEWDKTFPKSDQVKHSKVSFVNRFGITLAADMYAPKDAKGQLPAIAVSGP